VSLSFPPFQLAFHQQEQEQELPNERERFPNRKKHVTDWQNCSLSKSSFATAYSGDLGHHREDHSPSPRSSAAASSTELQ
jgi:hypothetical protein